MRIEIAFAAPFRRWQRRLAEELSIAGHGIVFVERGGKTLGMGTAVALALEQLVFGPRPSLFDRVRMPKPTAWVGGAAELTIVLDGVTAGAVDMLQPLFDGGSGDRALIAMLTGDQAPAVEIHRCRDDSHSTVASARLAVEDRTVLSRGLDQVLARTITLMVQAVRRVEAGEPVETVRAVPVPHHGRRTGSPSIHIARAITRKVRSRLLATERGPNHWRVAYRFDAQGCQRAGNWDAESFSILSDDETRFYADPMPFEHEGRTYVFVEDFPYATGKGVIAVSEIDPSGVASTPRLVLEHSCHLSYPIIIRHRGAIYMLPETSGARRIQLFRADPFPDRWVPDRILVDGVVAADATPIEHDGRWWLFATLSDDGGSSWDQLCLFHAPDLLGPWTPHGDNPVLVDAGAARPAGAMWREDGVLMRVAQDCRGGYGVGLTICRVDRLDMQGYAQTVIERREAPVGTGADGTHTLNRAGGFEVIDLRFSSRDSTAP